MAFDLDNEELKATRKLHNQDDGLYEETSDKNVVNIEEDIKYVKEMLEIARVFFKAVKAETNYKDVDDVAFCNAVEHILAEREQDKKRIKELEEERNHWHGCFIVAMENSIAKEKVKNVLKNNRNEIFSATYLSREQFRPYEMQIERINKIEQELIGEDK